MEKFIIYSDGGSRGNPGPGAFGFLIKSENNKLQITNYKKIPNLPAPQVRATSESKTGRQSLNIQIKNNIVYGSGFLGEVTNNQAEYNGILAALKFLKSQINSNDQNFEIECYLDSQLIVEQMNGKYKIKNEGLKPLYWEIREIILGLGGNISFTHIPREQNKEADKLVNEAIDKQI